jgi:hypothetical protein
MKKGISKQLTRAQRAELKSLAALRMMPSIRQTRRSFLTGPGPGAACSIGRSNSN